MLSSLEVQATPGLFNVHAAVDDLGLTKSWDRFNIDFTHCHEQLGIRHTSILDHFFWSETLNAGVIDAGVLHLPDNKFDHSPIYCVIGIETIQQEVSKAEPRKLRPSWKRGSQEEKQTSKHC